MMPLGLFRSRTFAGANLLTLLLYGAFGGALYFLPFNLIQVQGYSATLAGAALAPAVLIIFLLSRWTGSLAGRIGARLPLTIGPAVVGVALLLMALPGTHASYWTSFFPAVVVLGIGMAITVPPLTTAVMSAVSREQAGVASGINNAVSRTAGLLAVAILGVLVATTFASGLDTRLDDIPALPPEARAAVDAQKPDLAAAEPPSGIDQSLTDQIEAAIDGAFVAGFRLAMLAGAVMCFLAAAAAWLLIGRGPESGDDGQESRVKS
jgi:MFS family permease